MNNDEDMVEIACALEAETDLAYGIKEDDEMIWLPKSRCEFDVVKSIMWVPEWLAEKKGLI